jgi:AcrR family transcriptional regulator
MKLSNGERPASTRKTGRPRRDDIDRAVLVATRELLAERPYGDVGLGLIAERAGTTRQALYRRWPSKAFVVLDAFFAEPGSDPEMDSASGADAKVGPAVDARTGLVQLLEPFAQQLSDPAARAVVGGILSDLATNEDLRVAVYERYLEPAHQQVAAIVAQAGWSVDPDRLAESLAGAVIYRACFLGLAVEPPVVAALVDTVVGPVR